MPARQERPLPAHLSRPGPLARGITLDHQSDRTDLSDKEGPAIHPTKRILLRALADSLTLSRVGFAIGLALLGARQGQQGLTLAIGMIMAGWTADSVDGHFAHMAGGEGQTLIGRHDVTVDVIFSLGGLSYFTLAGYVSRSLALAYIVLAVATFLFRPVRATAILLQAPVAVVPAVVAAVHNRVLLLVLALWALALLVLDRRRFLWRLRQLRRGLPDLLGRADHS